MGLLYRIIGDFFSYIGDIGGTIMAAQGKGVKCYATQLAKLSRKLTYQSCLMSLIKLPYVPCLNALMTWLQIVSSPVELACEPVIRRGG